MSYIDKINRDGTDYDIQDSYAARSVEGTTASHVLQANEIFTETTQTQFAEFIYRTSAGDASIQTGPAQLEAVYGATIADPSVQHVDEVLTATPTFANEETTLEFNKNTWRSKVSTSGEYEFSYNGSNWRLDGSNVTLSQYGLTITGTVTSGDTINVSYTKMQTGTLTVANPTAFVATGFNQYNATAGYAHVVGGNQYRIAGTYTSLTFSTTPTGTTSAVTVTDNRFVPAEDGYIHVVGGSGNILIALVWSGIMDDEPWSAYETSTIVVPTQDAEGNNLPNASYGMPGIGNIRDSISFTEKLYIQRIGHLPFTYDNLETIQNSGAPYIYDTTHIFYALATPITYTLADTVDDDYTVNDFGTEEFTGTTIPVYAGIRYGNSLVDKLRNLVDIQDVGDDLTMDGSTIKTAHELKDDVPAGFFSGEATVSGEGSEFTLEGTMSAKLAQTLVEGNATQDLDHGRNLLFYLGFSDGKAAVSSNGIDAIVNTDGSIYVHGTASAKTVLYLTVQKPINIQGPFYYLCDSPSSYVRCECVVKVDGQNKYLNSYGTANFQDTAKSSEFSSLYVVVENGKVADCTFHPMLALGSTQETYEAYQASPTPDSPIAIKTATGEQRVDIYGKNLLGIDALSSAANISFLRTSTDSFRIRQETATGQNYSLSAIIPNSSALLGKTLTLSGNAIASNGSSGSRVIVWDNNFNQNYASLIPIKDTRRSVTFTLPSQFPTGATYFCVNFYLNVANATGEVGAQVDYFNMQLEEGSKATSYVSPRQDSFPLHLGNIELCSIGDNHDYIYKQGTQWFLHKTTNKITLDGVGPSWTVGNATNNSDYYYVHTAYYDSVETYYQSTTHEGMSNLMQLYRGGMGANQNAQSDTYSYGPKGSQDRRLRMMIKKTRLSAANSEAVNTFFSNNPMTFYYPIVHFTDVEITDSTLVGELNAIDKALSYDGTTYIITTSPSSNNAPLTVRATAYKKNLAGISGALRDM